MERVFQFVCSFKVIWMDEKTCTTTDTHQHATRTLRSRSLPTSCSWHHVSGANVSQPPRLLLYSITGGSNAKLAPSKSSPHQKYTSPKEWRISPQKSCQLLSKRIGLFSNHLLFRSFSRLQGCIQTFSLGLWLLNSDREKNRSRREGWHTTSRKEKPYK